MKVSDKVIQLRNALADLRNGRLDTIHLVDLCPEVLGELRSYGRSVFLRSHSAGGYSVYWRHYGSRALNDVICGLDAGESVLVPCRDSLLCSEYQVVMSLSKRQGLGITGRVTPEGLQLLRNPPGVSRHSGSARSQLHALPIGHSLHDDGGYSGTLIQACRIVVASDPLLFDVKHARANQRDGTIGYDITKLDILDLHDKPVRLSRGRGVLRNPLSNLRPGKTFLTRRMDRLTLDFLSGEYELQALG